MKFETLSGVGAERREQAKHARLTHSDRPYQVPFSSCWSKIHSYLAKTSSLMQVKAIIQVLKKTDMFGKFSANLIKLKSCHGFGRPSNFGCWAILMKSFVTVLHNFRIH